MPTLLHLSDVHFGPKHLDAPARAALAIAEKERPDVVVVSGDFTQRAKPAQFRAARRFVEAFSRPVVFVPGNHDVPLYRVWERALAPFGAWRRHFFPELVRDYLSAELAVLGLNSAHGWTTKHGRLRRRDLDELATRLAALPPDVARIVVVHHPVRAGAPLGDEPVARGATSFLGLAAAGGVDLVLSGHLHHGFVLPAGPRGEPPAAHVGTSSSSRGRGGEAGTTSVQWITLEADRIGVERRLWNAEDSSFRAIETVELPRRGRDRIPPHE